MDEKCEDCGIENETVSTTTCPFAADVHGKEVVITVCDECYHQRCLDI